MRCGSRRPRLTGSSRRLRSAGPGCTSRSAGPGRAPQRGHVPNESIALIAYTTPVGTASALGAGSSGQAWILSSMTCGLAVALLPAGAIGDDHARRRMFVVGALVLASSSIVATFAPTPPRSCSPGSARAWAPRRCSRAASG
jgi:hypothetical protein